MFAQNDKPPVDLNIIVRHVIDLEEVVVTCPEGANMRELKEILAVQVERPELVEVGTTHRCEPDGTHSGALKETMKVKFFRVIGFKGCPLHPPPPERPPATLEDCLDLDFDDVITSPRSVQACVLEGIPVGDLIHVPLSAYTDQGTELRIAELWFEFFEALRQDFLASAIERRKGLARADDGTIYAISEGKTVDSGNRIGGYGGHFVGCLQHSQYPALLRFFREHDEMCSIDRIYKGISKPGKSSGPASVKLSRSVDFWDQDPVLYSNTADEAAEKLDDVLHGYKCTRDSHRFVEEQRLMTEANGVVQYAMNVKKLHRDQKETKKVIEHRIETQEVQIANADADIQYRNHLRRGLDERALTSKAHKNKVEQLRMPKIRERMDEFTQKRERIHEKQLDDEYSRCSRLDELTLRDQAVEHRVHQHRSKKALNFARQWVLRRTRWQLNRNVACQEQRERSSAIMARHAAAAERVDAQRLITQKCAEYKREIAALRRLHADLARNREKMRADARREAVSAEFSRLAKVSASSLGHLHKADVTLLPDSPWLKQSRIMKREARFDFPQMAKGFFAASPTASTAASTTARSIGSPSLQNSVSSTLGDTSRIQSSVSAPSLFGGSSMPRREVRYDV